MAMDADKPVQEEEPGRKDMEDGDEISKFCDIIITYNSNLTLFSTK